MPGESGGAAENQPLGHRTLDDGSSDGELIAAVRAGDIDCFEPIVYRYRRQLLSTAYARLGDPAQSEDAVQETFLSAFRSLSTYDSRWSFRSWLWTILINECRKQYRQQKKREQCAAEQAAMRFEAARGEAGSPASEMIAQEQLRTVAELMKRLPDPQAEAIQLRFFGGMKYEEIAHAMRCGLTTAKNRVRVGLEKLSQWTSSKRIDD